MIRRLLRLFAVAAAVAAAGAAHAQQPAVTGEPSQHSKAKLPAPQLRLAPARADAPRVELPAAADEVLQFVRRENQRASARRGSAPQVRRVAIGMTRDVQGVVRAPAAGALPWSRVAQGHAAQIAVASPQAGSMRLAIDLAGMPEDVEMVFFGSADATRLEGPVRVGDIPDRTQPFWTPVTEGETQTVEFFVPARHDPKTLAARVMRASHLLATPSTGMTKQLQDIGVAGSCNVDIPCSQLNGDAAFRNAAESVAQMVITDGPAAFLCTGTLLNDGDPATQVPWFFSANHCFENSDTPFKTPEQMQQVASTLTTLWGFEASACVDGQGNATPRPTWSQLPGGATYIHNDVALDALFLRLNATPPAPAFFSGWDANSVSPGNPAIAIHHPGGDLKKVTEGTVQGFASPNRGGVTGSLIEVIWSRGTTEPGSSGGGLWTRSGSEYLLRGALWGGEASCAAPTAPDFYSRFDLVFPAIARFLGPGIVPALDVTDLWWNPAEDGWGLNLVQHPSRQVFGVWYTYAADGKRTWFVIPGGEWTSSNTFTGTIYSVAGPAASGFFDPNLVRRTPVGTATLSFSGTNTGMFNFTVNGISGSKAITRFDF